MNTQTKITLEEYKKKMGGYAGLLMYRYGNLVVKAEPISLLSATIISEDGVEKIEDVVAVVQGDDDFTLRLYVKDNDKLYPLTQALLREHPEYKIDCFRADNNEEANMPDDKDRTLYLLLTAPEVNKDRRDLLRDSTNALYHEAEGNMDLNSKEYHARILLLAKDESAEEMDALKKELKDIHDSHMDRINEMREKKLKEIEAGYKRFMNKKDNDGQQDGDTSAAPQESADGSSLKLW